MSSIGTGYHSKCRYCGKQIKGARYDLCKTCREMKRQERLERAEYEAKTVVTEQGETIATLRMVFDKVCNAKDWKASWVAYVSEDIVGIVCRAVEFYHADQAKVVGRTTTGRVLMMGQGYMA